MKIRATVAGITTITPPQSKLYKKLANEGVINLCRPFDR
jgi:hypothetical protein